MLIFHVPGIEDLGIPVCVCATNSYLGNNLTTGVGALMFYWLIRCGKSFSNIPKYMTSTLTFDLLLKIVTKFNIGHNF